MARYTIHVTQEDIDYGIAGHCSQCPVARAIARATGRQVHVNSFSFRFTHEFMGERSEYSLPRIAQDFIYAFDNGGLNLAVFQPFTFEVEIAHDPYASW